MKSLQALAIQREERWPCAAMALLFLFFHVLIIAKYWPLFADFSARSWYVFNYNYHMSGFDPITYDVLSDWYLGYNQIRHPLLAFLLYPFYLLNRLLTFVTGTNCALLIMAVLLMLCVVSSYLFLYRLLRRVMGLGAHDTVLLSFFFFSFAYILLALLVPDHFAFSLALLLFALYRAGTKMKRNERFGIRETLLLFLFTAGITLSNGVAVLAMVLFTNGRHFFARRFLISVVVLPVFFVCSFAGTVKLLHDTVPPDVRSVLNEQMKWVSTDISKTDVLIENWFGESIQLHRKHLLADVLIRRPVIVQYTSKAQYAAELLIVLLAIAGAFFGHRRRFTWLLLFIAVQNVLLHIVLGFGIKEVFIMAAHWIFVIPLLIGWLVRCGRPRIQWSVRIVVAALALYLWIYHGYLLSCYLSSPLIYVA